MTLANQADWSFSPSQRPQGQRLETSARRGALSPRHTNVWNPPHPRMLRVWLLILVFAPTLRSWAKHRALAILPVTGRTVRVRDVLHGLSKSCRVDCQADRHLI